MCLPRRGLQAEVLRTTDGGQNFTTVKGINFGLDLLLLAAEAKGNTVIVTSIFGEMYSLNDGKSFFHSIGGGTSQSVRYIGGLGAGDALHFGIAGQALSGRNQVGYTNNGGISFTTYATAQYASPRYAAWPKADIWYSAAGDFPTNPPPPPSPPAAGGGAAAKRPRRHRKSVLQDADGYWRRDAWTAEFQAGTTAGYQAQISKTEDHGKTWTSQFVQNNSYYFNEIDCAPGGSDVCCAAAECGNGAAAGGYIVCTTDGGKSWKETWHEMSTPGKQSISLMGLEYSSPTEAWACGGIIKQFSMMPLFLHSTDAGATWEQVPGHPDTKNHICLGIDMLTPTDGYAALDDVTTQVRPTPRDPTTRERVGAAVHMRTHTTHMHAHVRTHTHTHTRARAHAQHTPHTTHAPSHICERRHLLPCERAGGKGAAFCTGPQTSAVYDQVTRNDGSGCLCVYTCLVCRLAQTAGIGKYGTGTPPAPPAPPAPPVPPPPGMFHYGDPNAGPCLKDEQSVEITGLSGKFCSPGCGLFIKCPIDVPDRATAKPSCALQPPGSATSTQCALECDPSAAADQCPDKASCKAIQSVGLCTYDT